MYCMQVKTDEKPSAGIVPQSWMDDIASLTGSEEDPAAEENSANSDSKGESAHLDQAHEIDAAQSVSKRELKQVRADEQPSAGIVPHCWMEDLNSLSSSEEDPRAEGEDITSVRKGDSAIPDQNHEVNAAKSGSKGGLMISPLDKQDHTTPSAPSKEAKGLVATKKLHDVTKSEDSSCTADSTAAPAYKRRRLIADDEAASDASDPTTTTSTINA